jgi:hypothetical protein
MRSIRKAAVSSEVDPAERPVVDCRVNPEWSVGLTVHGHPEWLADVAPDTGDFDGPQGLVSVLVARRYKWGRVSVCGYLADVHCLGVKNTFSPEIMTDSVYPFVRRPVLRGLPAPADRGPAGAGPEPGLRGRRLRQGPRFRASSRARPRCALPRNLDRPQRHHLRP